MKKKRKLILPVLIFLIFSNLTYKYFFTGDYNLFNLFSLTEENKVLEANIERLEKEIEETKILINKIQNKDPFEMEKLARAKGMKKKDEIVFKFDVKKEN